MRCNRCNEPLKETGLAERESGVKWENGKPYCRGCHQEKGKRPERQVGQMKKMTNL